MKKRIDEVYNERKSQMWCLKNDYTNNFANVEKKLFCLQFYLAFTLYNFNYCLINNNNNNDDNETVGNKTK